MKTENKNQVNQTTTANAFATALTEANHFASKIAELDEKVEKDWKTLVKNLHRTAYDIYALCERKGLKTKDTSVNKDDIYTALKVALDLIGTINGHKLHCNEQAVLDIIAYSGKRANQNSEELTATAKELAEAKKELDELLNADDIDKTAVSVCKGKIKALTDERDAILQKPDARVKVVTMTSNKAFRLEFEHLLARAIDGIKAPSFADIQQAKAKAKKVSK